MSVYVVSVHMCARSQMSCCLIPLTLFFETGTLSPELCSVSFHSSPSVLELCMAMPGFLFQFRDLNSGPHARTEYTFTSWIISPSCIQSCIYWFLFVCLLYVWRCGSVTVNVWRSEGNLQRSQSSSFTMWGPGDQIQVIRLSGKLINSLSHVTSPCMFFHMLKYFY